MNIIQSFWSRPLSYHLPPANEPFKGGWLSEKHHAISCAYSLFQLRKFHPGYRIKMFTDKKGYSWLINRLGLEYDDVYTELDVLNCYPEIFWCLGKIYTYSKQQEPFIHVDSDVFIWEPFDLFFQNKKMLFQNFEINYPVYQETLIDCHNSEIAIPHPLRHLLQTGSDIVSANFGVMGSNDIELIQEYCRICFDFINNNREKIMRSEQAGNYNTFFEQLLLTQMALQKFGSAMQIGTIVPDEYGQVTGLTRFSLVPHRVKFIHMIGYSKCLTEPVCHLEHRFAYEYPEYYKHILHLYPQPPVYYIYNRSAGNLKGESPNFYERTPFFACNIQLQKLQPGADNADADTLEALLEENFDNPQYVKLWDLYQIESAVTQREQLADEFANIHYEDMLYETSEQDFMNIPLKLNNNVCKIVYLFHSWQGGLYKNNIASFATGMLELPFNNPGVVPEPWLAIQNLEHMSLKKTNGWYGAILLIAEQPQTGNQLAEQLCGEDTGLKQDLYAFLSSQLRVYRLISPASVTSTGLCTSYPKNQDRCIASNQ